MRGSAKRVAQRVPGMREVLRLREENLALRAEQERLRAELGKARKEARGLQGSLAGERQRRARARERANGLVEVRKGLTSRLRRTTEAASWLDRYDQTGGSKPVQGIRARAAAASLIESLAGGTPLPAALVAYARALRQVPRYPFGFRLPAVVRGFASLPGMETASAAAMAVHGYYTDHGDLARDRLAACGDDAPRLIPVEYARISLADAPDRAGEVVEAILDSANPDAEQWLDILSAVAATGDLATLGRAVAAVEPSSAAWSESERVALARFAEYGARAGRTPVAEEGEIHFGVIGYRRPDVRTSSRNIGDYTQTISALGHLVRRTGVRLTGEPELVEAVEALRDRVRPDLRLDDDDATVRLVEISRDDSPLDLVPERTWLIAFGWYIHPDGLGRYQLPFHPNLRPIFVSFHVNRREMLSDAALEYLRRYAPIGCRDWSTVDLLTRLGVPAFFTGCLTTTVDAYFGPRESGAEELPHGYVDSPTARKRDVVVRQAYEEVRHRPVGENLRVALETLDEYRAGFGSITTSRLHCYLPATSIGIPTTFAPRRTFDVRFEGLTDEHADLDAIRTRIRTTLLEPIMTSILAGAEEEDVYDQWRALTEPMVERDVAARATAYSWPETDLDIAGTVELVRGASWSRAVEAQADPVDLCFVLDRNYVSQLYTVLDRAVSLTDRPLRVWALVRGLSVADFEDVAAAFPEVSLTFLPCDGVDYGAGSSTSHRITVSTMDRLLLPELLAAVDPTVSKVLYLDLDLLPRADLAELFDTDLGESPLAARPSLSAAAMGGLANYVDVAQGAFPRTVEGWRLLNLVRRQSGNGDVGFNAGVLLFNLDRMRADRFLERYCGFAEQFGLNDQYVLNLYAGSTFHPLSTRWNAWPDRDVVDGPDREPHVVHWVGPFKPWGTTSVLFQQEWHDAVAAMRERRGGPAEGPAAAEPELEDDVVEAM